MSCDQAEVFFFERLGVVDYALSVFGKRKVFYKTLSFGLRAAQSVFSLNLDGAISRIWYGSLDATTGIRKAAYQQAKLDVSQLSGLMESLDQQRFLDTDCAIPVEKVIFDHFYSRYEFFGYAARFASEHPECRVVLKSNISAKWPQGFDLGPLKLKQRVACRWLEYLGLLAAIPLIFYGFCFKNRGTPKLPIRNAVVCEVDNPKILEMFASLFSDRKDLHFVAQKQYMGSLVSASDTSRRIEVHRLDPIDIEVLRAMTKRLVAFLIRDGRYLFHHGAILFEIYKTFLHGLLLTPNANNCLYLTFEHLSPTKSVRNVLLSARHTKSVFAPYNVYAIDHFFAHEYRYNYDILCSPGELLERVYRLQMATTPVILRTGAYSPHLGMDSSSRRPEQIDRLLNFKQGATLITVLSSGIHDGSYTGELKLLSLAMRLAQVPGVKVAIRQKPGSIPEKFKSFFCCLESPQANLLLTHSEYDLFDFLPVTDLFITSISSSAVDLCVAGGQFYSVDYWADKDLYLWQTAVDGVFIPQNIAFDTVVSWVKDDPPGVRLEHRRRMARLSSHIAYQFESFEQYRNNFQALVAPYLPSAMEGERVQ
jgi:hypothetical protein